MYPEKGGPKRAERERSDAPAHRRQPEPQAHRGAACQLK